MAWEELGIELAVRARQALVHSNGRSIAAPAAAIARVTDVVRAIDRDPSDVHSLGLLANNAGLSPFHFLRTFEHVTGVTPHQYVQRRRLLRAASRLIGRRTKIVEVAFDSGFGDVSNFNRAFRREFGVSPREYRRGDYVRCGAGLSAFAEAPADK